MKTHGQEYSAAICPYSSATERWYKILLEGQTDILKERQRAYVKKGGQAPKRIIRNTDFKEGQRRQKHEGEKCDFEFLQ